MYSKGYSEKRKYFGDGTDAENGEVLLPPRYSGVRFVKEKRSDGREGVYERTYTAAVPMTPPENKEGIERSAKVETNIENENSGETETVSANVSCASNEKEEGKRYGEKSTLSDVFSFIKEDDLLIIALILILAGQRGENNREIILLLAILLCFR